MLLGTLCVMMVTRPLLGLSALTLLDDVVPYRKQIVPSTISFEIHLLVEQLEHGVDLENTEILTTESRWCEGGHLYKSPEPKPHAQRPQHRWNDKTDAADRSR